MPSHCDRRETLRWTKIGPPRRGCPEKPRGSVAALARGKPSPHCALLLATGLFRAITAGPI